MHAVLQLQHAPDLEGPSGAAFKPQPCSEQRLDVADRGAGCFDVQSRDASVATAVWNVLASPPVTESNGKFPNLALPQTTAEAEGWGLPPPVSHVSHVPKTLSAAPKLCLA